MFLSLRMIERALKSRGAAVAVAMLLLSAIASCQPQSEGSQSAQDSKSKDAETALPSMSSYTSERMSNPTADDLNGSDKAADAGAGLSPGEYCFYKAGEANWLSIRLQVDGNRQITGETSGTVNHPEKGKTRYQQAFTGTLKDQQAAVEVTTYLADTSSSRQEDWIVSDRLLDMGRIAIESAPCSEVSSSF